MDTLEYLKVRITALKGTAPSDDLLETFVEDAQRIICEYCGLTEVPTELQGIEKTLALRAYNLMGIEGLSSYSQGGRSLGVEDLSKSERSRLNRHRSVIVGDSSVG